MPTYSGPAATLTDDTNDPFLAKVFHSLQARDLLRLGGARDKYAQCELWLAESTQKLEGRAHPHSVGVEIPDVGKHIRMLVHQR